jgi:hypothetical protein
MTYNAWSGGRSTTWDFINRGLALSGAPSVSGWSGIYKSQQFGDRLGNICWTCATMRLAGCFDPSVLILMADGSQKRADQISAGDTVRNPVTGNAERIARVIESLEDRPMYTVLVAGHSLTVTYNHPFRTRSGFVNAEQLIVGHEVEIANHEFQPVSEIRSEARPGQRVINFKFDTESRNIDDHFLLSEGTVTGNAFVQEALR